MINQSTHLLIALRRKSVASLSKSGKKGPVIVRITKSQKLEAIEKQKQKKWISNLKNWWKMKFKVIKGQVETTGVLWREITSWRPETIGHLIKS